MSLLLIQDGHILDPASGRDEISDIYVVDGFIRKVGKDILSSLTADEKEKLIILSAKKCFVMPGFIDLHVHLRDPGQTHKEDIHSGALAAAKGGFTTICAMPNTNPVIDSSKMVHYVKEKAKKEACVNVLQIAAITMGQAGETLTDFHSLKEAGAIALSEDGKSVMDAVLYEKAIKEAESEDLLIMAHCEDKDLVGNGVMHESTLAKKLGLPEITHEVEDRIVNRDIQLAAKTKARLHLCHCTTKEGVKLIKEAKNSGVLVTAEVCPHHFTLSVEDIPGDDADYKMNPPLRDKEDVKALIEGLKTGVIDVIATDHAPHQTEEKAGGFISAPFGIVGLETAAVLTFTELVSKGILTPMEMAACMSYKPACIIGIDKGSLKPGTVADITIFDPSAEYQIEKDKFVSKSNNTPFDGKTVKGCVRATIVSGEIVYKA